MRTLETNFDLDAVVALTAKIANGNEKLIAYLSSDLAAEARGVDAPAARGIRPAEPLADTRAPAPQPGETLRTYLDRLNKWVDWQSKRLKPSGPLRALPGKREALMARYARELYLRCVREATMAATAQECHPCPPDKDAVEWSAQKRVRDDLKAADAILDRVGSPLAPARS